MGHFSRPSSLLSNLVEEILLYYSTNKSLNSDKHTYGVDINRKRLPTRIRNDPILMGTTRCHSDDNTPTNVLRQFTGLRVPVFLVTGMVFRVKSSVYRTKNDKFRKGTSKKRTFISAKEIYWLHLKRAYNRVTKEPGSRNQSSHFRLTQVYLEVLILST